MNESPTKKPRLTPRYRELADALIAEISDGHYSIGERLPGEIELTQQFGVSRHTVREALRVLEDLGLIRRQRGVGTVVQARRVGPSYVQAVRQPDELLQYPDNSRLHVVEAGKVKLNRVLGRKMGCPAGSHWCRIAAVRRVVQDDEPLCFVEIFVRPEYAAIAGEVGKSNVPVYELLATRFGLEVDSVELNLSAGLVTVETEPLLMAPAGSPTMELVRRYHSDEGVFEVSVSQHPADRFNYSLKFKKGWRTGSNWGWR